MVGSRKGGRDNHWETVGDVLGTKENKWEAVGIKIGSPVGEVVK